MLDCPNCLREQAPALYQVVLHYQHIYNKSRETTNCNVNSFIV